MTTDEQIEKVKEIMRPIICLQCDGISHADTCDLPKSECPVLITLPTQILNLKDKEANLLLAILHPDQSLPKNPWVNAHEIEQGNRLQCIANYEISQQDMLNANFRRVIKEAK